MGAQYIGVDLHKAFFQVCAMDAAGTVMWEGRYARDRAGVDLFLQRVSPGARMAVEATTPTWHFVDAIQEAGYSVVVVDPRKTRLKAGYAAKTDRLDARRLADALRRDSVVSIYIPTREVREWRELARARQHLVRTRTRIVQTIRALLLRQGIGDAPVTRLTGRRGRRWLTGLVLPGRANDALRRLERVLDVVDAEARAADAAVQAVAATEPISQQLDHLVGIGPVLALLIRAEVGEVARFGDGAHLASYAGLVPRVEQSGTRAYHGRITKQGSPWLRWALVEAAMHARRRRDARGRWYRRLAVRKGGLKARVGLARVMCDEIVRTWRAAL